VFIDADIGWDPEAFAKLFNVAPEMRVVAGAPQKRDGSGFCGHLDRQPRMSGFCYSGETATAFLRIETSVFGELEPKVERYNFDGVDYAAFFQMAIRNGEMPAEDIFFSRLCRANGVDVWIDPTISLRHWTTMPMTARMIDRLRPALKEAV
jgi:hypothetical protein